MKKYIDIVKAYYIISGKGEFFISLVFVLGFSFLLVVEPVMYAYNIMAISMNDDQLKATIVNSETSKVFPFRNGYKVEVGFQIGETRRTEIIYTLDKPKCGTQVALNYGYNKNGNIGVICPEIETIYPPMFGGSIEASSFLLPIFVFCLHILSTVKRGIRKLRLIKYGETTNASFVSRKKFKWISERSQGEATIFRLVYKYSVGNEDYTVTADARKREKDFKGTPTMRVVYDPANPKNAMFSLRVKELLGINPIKQYFVGTICLAMSLVFICAISAATYILIA